MGLYHFSIPQIQASDHKSQTHEMPVPFCSAGHINDNDDDRPHICHRYHRLYLWRKICHVEKFQISVKNLNNLWSFIEIYAVFVLNLCGEKSVWRKNDKYEVCKRTALFLRRTSLTPHPPHPTPTACIVLMTITTQ